MALDHVRVLAGTARCGKTTFLLERYRRVLGDAEPGSLLWLAPTALAARQLRRRLLTGELRACFQPRIWTFDQFVQSVLEASGQVVRRISLLQSAEIIRHLLYRLHGEGKLQYLKGILDSPGTASWVAQFIQELKHHEIWPEHFQRASEAAGGLSAKDHDVLLVYQQYQQFLLDNALYDPAGGYWQARTLLQQGQQQPVDRLRLLVVDGFTDFTRTQQEILQELFGRAKEAWLSLPLELDSSREELFARSRRTWEQFLQPLGAQLVEQPARPSGWPAMDYLQQTLFVPQAEPYPKEPSGITLTAAPGVTHEIKQVARQIKHLLVHGDPQSGEPVSPAQVLVIARRVEPLAERIGQEFAAAGVPVFLEAGVPLARSGLGQAVLQILQLVESDGAFDQVVALLSNSSLRPPHLPWDTPTAMTVRQAVRRCQVAQGLDRLLNAYRQLVLLHQRMQQGEPALPAGEEETEALLLPQRNWSARHLQAGQELLQRLHAALVGWNEPARLPQWIQRLENVLRELGLHPEQQPPGSPGRETDRRAWNLLQGELHALARLLELTQADPLQPPEFLATLRDLLQQLTYQPPCVPDACVRVVSAIHARGASSPWVFVIGLTEESFPAVQDHPAVYSLAQRRQLRQQQLALPVEEDHHQGEMILFYEVLTRARRRLWLSYPALNEKAEPLLPSPYLQEVQRLLNLAPAGEEEQTLVQVPRDNRAINARERWLLAVEEARQGNLQWLSWSLHQDEESLCQQLFRGWQSVWQRGQFGRFGPWEGMLDLDPALEAVQRRWAQGSTVSVTSLEKYAFCPWRFLMERFLDIRPLEEPAEELEKTQLGLLFHSLMARGHRQQADLQHLAQCSAEEFLQQWAPLVEEVLEEHFGPEDQRPGMLRALARLTREDLREMLRAYHEQMKQYVEILRKMGWTQFPRPTHLELAFGGPPDQGEDRPPPAFLLQRGEHRLHLSGRVDRVDVGTLGPHQVALVIDYKTGGKFRSPKGEEAPSPTALQLELYPAALEAIFKPMRVLESGYWSVRLREGGKGYKLFVKRYLVEEGKLKSDPQWQQRWENLQELVFRLWQGIRSGQFAVFSEEEDCTRFCPLKRICRIGQVRDLNKTWQPPEP